MLPPAPTENTIVLLEYDAVHPRVQLFAFPVNEPFKMFSEPRVKAIGLPPEEALQCQLVPQSQSHNQPTQYRLAILCFLCRCHTSPF